MIFYPKLHSFFIASLLSSTLSLAQDIESKNIVIPSTLPLLKDAKKFATNEIIVTFKKDSTLFKDKDLTNPMNKIVQKRTLNFTNKLKQKFGQENFKIKSYKHLGLMHLKATNLTNEELIEYFTSEEMRPYVESVSKNNIIVPTNTNDKYYNKLWGLENIGQEINNVTGIPDADIDAPEAWTKTKGEQSVIVAVLDTGIDYTHSDLQDNMWNGEPHHGVDFAGDNEGNNDDDPMPDLPYDENGHYHGTHVAGILGAVSDNNNGVAGVAQHISIMSLKVFRPNGYGFTSDVLEAIEYISERIESGDNIVAINASYGGYDGSQGDPLNLAIKKLGEKGVLFCTSAGNESKNIDEVPSYPASYDASNIIVVAASDQHDNLASFSNYGEKSVDVVAPGMNILSTYPNNQYAYMQGTSMATPYVSGTIALIASLYGDSTLQERREMLLNSVDKKESLNNKVNTSGRINVNNALNEKQTSRDVAPTEEVEEITLPTDEQIWKEVDLTNNPIKFTTKENITVEMRHNKQRQLISTISSNKKSSNLLLDLPNGHLQIDHRGNAILNFQEKGISLKINSRGEIKSDFLNLEEAMLPKDAFPLGTTLNMNVEHISFTLPLTDNINF